MKRGNRIRETLVDRVFDVANLTILVLLTLCILAPLVNVVACSFSAPGAITSYRVYLWPVGFNADGYRAMFALSEIWMGYGNSLFYAIVGTSINLLVTVLAAYPLACKGLMGRKVILGIFTFTMFFGGGMIPTYLVVRSLGMVNTRWAMLIPGALGVSNMIIARTFFMTSIPGELKEAAEIDGANEAVTLLRIVLPLSMPILAVLALYYAVGHWNGYMSGLIYLNDNRLYPLQLILRDYLLSTTLLDNLLSGGAHVNSEELGQLMGMRELLKYAIIIVAALPMLLMYPFAQRYFMKGVMVGSLKG